LAGESAHCSRINGSARTSRPQADEDRRRPSFPFSGTGVAYDFAPKTVVIPDKLGGSGTAASAVFTPRSRIFALRARPG
jgi:hypothetical protein